MTTDLERYLAKIDEIATWVDGLKTHWFAAEAGVERFAFFHHTARMRLPRVLRAYALLVRNDLGQEGDAIARMLAELAINAAWIGGSRERANEWFVKGQHDSSLWVQTYEDSAGGLPEDVQEQIAKFRDEVRRNGTPTMARLKSRVHEARIEGDVDATPLMKHIYETSYARLCEVSHVTQQAQGALLLGRHAAVASASDVVIAATALIQIQGTCLPVPAMSEFAGRLTEWIALAAAEDSERT